MGVKDAGALVMVPDRGIPFHLLSLTNSPGLGFVLLGEKIELIWKLGQVLSDITINNSSDKE